jgi:hypothetical protein
MEAPLPASNYGPRLKTYTDALRELARSDSPDRGIAIRKNIDLCLTEGEKELLLEGLRCAINNEESEGREGEDWSTAREYVRSLLLICSSDAS